MGKTNVIFMTGVILTGMMIFISNKTGVATNQSKDRTGSPIGEAQQCGQCHTGGNFGVTIDIRLKDVGGNEVTSYVPFVQYTYEVELTGAGAEFGFQTVALNATTNANAGALTALSSNAKIVSLNGRSYGEQVTRSVSGIFQMQWNAPPSGTGDVKFYAAGIACNASNSTSGDQAITSPSLTISENINGLAEFGKNDDFLTIFPNPATETVTLKDTGNENFSWMIYDLTGKIILTGNTISGTSNIDLSGFTKGIYVVQAFSKSTKTKLLTIQ